MGADAFYVYYGVRYEVASDEEAERLEMRQDARVAAARKVKLKFAFGRLTDGEPYFLLIGHEIGRFGAQDASEAVLSDDQLRGIFEETKRKLADAGFRDVPRLVFQLCGQY
ncbi:hypothetical protein [Humisphaera borealis]|uniref:Uncharacterized protein n=1 Tax=Humisphaera borealis TaxID=2807512 RepID=A0A7M2WW77_9BACT|nr:hypothetical protein [Humisphaera borealis]QOV89101.1 hypothetical protein IPV69_23240 [Humisphaera borealis]